MTIPVKDVTPTLISRTAAALFKIAELTKAYAKADRLKRAAAKKEAERSKALQEISDALRQELVDHKLESVRIGRTNYTVTNRQIAELYDADEFFAYVKKTNSFDLVHRRVTMEAARERWAQGKEVPGVRPGTVPTLSVTKAR